MNKMFTALIGVLLLAVHVSSQTSNDTDTPSNTTMSTYTSTPMMGNGTENNTTKGAGASLRSDVCALLFPVALAASLLHGRF